MLFLICNNHNVGRKIMEERLFWKFSIKKKISCYNLIFLQNIEKYNSEKSIYISTDNSNNNRENTRFSSMKTCEITRAELFCTLLNSLNPISEREKLPTLSEPINYKSDLVKSMLRTSDYRFFKSIRILKLIIIWLL